MPIFTSKAIHRILSIPIVGGFLTTGLALIPAFLLGIFGAITLMIVIVILPSNAYENLSTDYFLLILILVLVLLVIPLTWWWLNYLERKINVSVVLPIPFIDIPVKWFLYPFMLPLFGIRDVYRHFYPETERVTGYSSNIIEIEKKEQIIE